MRGALATLVVASLLACCFGPSEPDAPAPAPLDAPATPGPLSQALSGLDPAPAAAPAAPDAAPDAPAAPAAPSPTEAPAAPVAPSAPAAPSAPVSPSPTVSVESAACADARARREDVRARLRELRLTVGLEAGRRLDAASRALAACEVDPACVTDGQGRAERWAEVQRAQAAVAAENASLARAEAQLYPADQAVRAACGAE